MREIDMFRDYENAKIETPEEYRLRHAGTTVPFDSLGERDVDGIPVAVTRNGEGKLDVTFVEDSHLLAIGATRSGKTTGYVIPTLNILLRKKNKPSLVISDPKQELYRGNVKKFIDAGYRVLLFDFNNYRHSDCWNPLTKIYRLYQQSLHVEDGIDVVETPDGYRNRLNGEIYDSQKALDRAVAELRELYVAEAEKGLIALAMNVIPTYNTRDPFWEDSARDLLCAVLFAMLEDSEKGLITEDTFSFDTVLRIVDSFTDSESNYDGGYFTNRMLKWSKGYQLAQKCIIEQASNTRRCISSSFASKMSKFRDTSVRKITCTNTFEMSSLDDGAPTVIFLSYKDEECLHYEVISMLLSNLYTELIAVARRKKSRLTRPFYFLLDEFGNLPPFKDFDKVISACGGRNIWFLLILQSYAQLYHVYGKETAEIIKDNMNVHVFFGTNNPETKREFSEECGKKTIIAPTSALNGTGESIGRFEKDTVALVPVSALNRIMPGDCIVTQMREEVLWSHIERSYLCPEFASDDAEIEDRAPTVSLCDPRYRYTPQRESGGRKKRNYF